MVIDKEKCKRKTPSKSPSAANDGDTSKVSQVQEADGEDSSLLNNAQTHSEEPPAFKCQVILKIFFKYI